MFSLVGVHACVCVRLAKTFPRELVAGLILFVPCDRGKNKELRKQSNQRILQKIFPISGDY